MRTLLRRAAVLGVGVLIASACGDRATSTPADDSGVDLTLPAPGTKDDDEPSSADYALDGSWRMTSGVVGATAIVAFSGWDVTLTVAGDRIGGTAACNGYGGTAELGVGTLRIGELGWTEMACEPDVMELEQSYLRALQGITSFAIGEGSLRLSGPTAELTFEALRPVPTERIVGPTWVLDTVIGGDAASTASLSSATLTLADDGTLTGSTGCRRLAGSWAIAGDRVVFTAFAAIDNPAAGVCEPGSEKLDGFIVGVLADGFTVEVDGNRLTVMAPGNEGLSYTAG